MANTKTTTATPVVEKKRGRPAGAEVDSAAVEARKNLPIPEFRDSEGVLNILKSKDFPTSKVGKIAFIDYSIAKLQDKKTQLEEKSSPKSKNLAKMKRLRAALAKLEKLQEEMGE